MVSANINFAPEAPSPNPGPVYQALFSTLCVSTHFILTTNHKVATTSFPSTDAPF